jgi:hypothetical protein
MFIPMVLSFVAGITLTVFAGKSIKGQGASLLGVFGFILGLALISFAIYLALPQ